MIRTYDELELPPIADCVKCWTLAAKGDEAAVIDWILEHGLCISRLPLLLTAASEHKRLSAFIEENKNAAANRDTAVREREITVASRGHASNVAKHMALEDEANQKAAAAEQLVARVHIAQIHARGIVERFTPFFGIERLLPATNAIPPALYEVLKKLNVAENDGMPWSRESPREVVPKPRRHVSAKVGEL